MTDKTLTQAIAGIEWGAIQHLIKRAIPNILCSIAEIEAEDMDNQELLIETEFMNNIESVLTDSMNQLICLSNEIKSLVKREELLREALTELTDLKAHKEIRGKTIEYNGRMPLAWQKALKALRLTDPNQPWKG